MFEQIINRRTTLLIDTLVKSTAIAEDFYLSGGTALALHLGHRISEDLDFFTPEKFENDFFVSQIIDIGGEIISEARGTIHSFLKGTKLSLFYYPYPVLDPFIKFRGVKIASIRDIGCMKAVALSQRAEKKDFFDLYEILKRTTPDELKQMFLQKYGKARVNCYHILKSFFYFDDAEDSPDPMSLNNTLWPDVKKYFLEHKEEIESALLRVETIGSHLKY